jgi:hypothetical protein
MERKEHANNIKGEFDRVLYNNHNDAVGKAIEFVGEINELETKYGFSLNTDHEIYLTYRNNDEMFTWSSVNLGWAGDGTPIRVTEVVKDKQYYKLKALSKLSKEECEALGV